jgi:hypothetical protein
MENAAYTLRGWQFGTLVHSPAAGLHTLTSHGHEVVLIHRSLLAVAGTARS